MRSANLADQSAGRVDNWSLATIGDVAIPNHFVSLTLLTESQSLQQNEFVRRKAIMKLANLDILG